MPVQSHSEKVLDLRFDPHNPRLPEDVDRTQEDMFRFIVREIGVDDLLDSLSTSGVIDADPIIVREADQDEEQGHYYVIEGNRRLAALRLLNGGRLNDGEAEKSIPALTPEIANSVKYVRVETGWEDDQLEAYLGYKHVTSSREWAPEAKARFVVERCKGDFSQERLKQFAKRLGTNVATLRRWLSAYLTLKEAQATDRFKPEDAFSRRYFGTFYTLLGSKDVQEFLSLNNDLTLKPVPDSKLDNLSDFISWTIGTKANPPAVNSRQQKEFSAVLSSPQALRYFRSKKNLTQALLYTEFNATEIVAKLQLASYTIEECLPKVFDVREQSQVQSAIADVENAVFKLKLNSSRALPA